MKRSSCIVLRPVCFLMVLVLMVLSLSGLLIPLWIIRVTKIENEVKVTAKKTNQELISGIRKTATLFSPINASAINLVRVLTSSLEEHNFQFSKIESKVASTLFQALSTVPYLSQISYIGLDGLFFAYYTQENQIYAMYSNSTFSDAKNYSWYIQSVNRDSGKLYGEAIKSPPFDVVNSTYFQEASSNKNGYASVGTSWGDTQNILLLSTVSIYGKGVVSLGYPMQSLIDFLINEIRFYDGSFYLASKRDGSVLAQGIPNTRMILAGDRVAFQLLSEDDYGVSEVGNLTCQSNDDSTSRNYVVSFSGKEYVINCSPLDIAGLPLVYALAMPHEGLSSLVHKNIKLAFVMLMLMIGVVVITILTFVYLIVEAARREMHLCGALISQMEATQQSERKSMNKSLAFASASHDIRASLAGINGLIEICRNEVSKRDPLRSEIPANLLQMESCTRDLLGILNSILDTSKIEAGKMQLDEEEFDLEKLMEDVVDLYHPVGTKKGVDVILDPFDGSVTKFSRVRGDRGKLKQILSNLLSNAVKFTSNGHVVVRVWAKKPSLESGIISSNRSNVMSCLLCLFKIQRAYSESEATQRETNNRTEFVFEVNDTGKGIPKEKQKSVFENYVQVKETALGQEGTGLGLGIVQSLVRLMGGEIGIVDKEAGERGTCFRFNAFFETDGNSSPSADIESIGHDSFRHSGTSLRTHSPKNDGSQVLLLIDSPERSTLLQDFMHRIGIKVHVVKQYEQLSPSLKRIKRKLNLSNYSSSGKSTTSSARSKKEFPLSALEGTDDVLPNPRPGFSGFVLIVIDTSVGPFREISRAVAEFRRDLSENCCSRVVWLDSLQGLDEDNLPPLDLVISKPFHGSRLYRTIGLLPEFGGLPPPRRGEASHSVENVRRGNDVASSDGGASKSSVKGSKCEIEEVGGANSKKKPLMGRKILVADDDPIGRKIATFVGVQLGASIFPCENGEEAWKLVCKSLDEGKHVGASKSSLPFDCILMDCEMPMMNGVEATARIRKAEESYGVRIPIIALTAHKKGQEIDNMIQAGVDGYLTKPLNKDVFLKIISEIICNV
ncbi:hypothetical protein ABFX02_12G052200 [Erythranthe guttata]